MMTLVRLGSVVLLAGLAGCVLPPPPPPPLVALPGPGKTEAQFQADDGTCRAAADAAPPAETVSVPAQGQPSGTSSTQAPATPQQMFQITPGMVYLQCMTAHDNVVQPLAPVRPLYYGFYNAYPIYYGFGDTYPWLYGGPFGFGFYGGGFYGRGFYGGGFYGGGGFHDGFRGGRFHGRR